MSGGEVRVEISRPVLNSEDVARNQSCQQQQLEDAGQSKRISCCKNDRGLASVVRSVVPAAEWLPAYSLRSDLAADVVAGVTVAIMHIPQGMAYATLAEVDPVFGLYTAIFPVIIYAILGPSRHVSMGTNPLTSMLIGSLVGKMALAEDPASSRDLVSSLCLLVGLWQGAFSALGLGRLSWVLSEVLVSGYTTAAAVHVLASQLKGLLGISLESRPGPLKLIYLSVELFHKISSVNWAAFVISLACVTALVLNNEILKPELSKHCSFPLPIQLLVVAAGAFFSFQFDFASTYGVDTVGMLPTGFPSPMVPDPSLFPHMLVESLIIAVLGYSITLSMAKIFAGRFGYSVDGNQELFSEGAANVFGSFFSSMPSGASMSRSAVQVGVGGRTQLTSAVSVCCLAVVILFAGPLFATLPKAVLSSIIVVALKGMLLQYHDLRKFWSRSKSDGALWAATFAAVILLDVDSGLVAGVACNLVLLVYRAVKVRVEQVTELGDTGLFVKKRDSQQEGYEIIKVSGAVTFANFESASEALKKNHTQDGAVVVILDLSSVPYLDTSGAKMVKQWLEDQGRTNTAKSAQPPKRILAGPTASVERTLSKFEVSSEVVFPSVVDAARFCQNLSDWRADSSGKEKKVSTSSADSGIDNEAFAVGEEDEEEGTPTPRQTQL